MFTITSTRIVGLIAVVCAVVVAPQALAASSAHSRLVPPGDDPSSFDLSAPNTLYVQGLARAAFAAGAQKSVEAATFVYKLTNPGWGAAATAAKKPAPEPAAIPKSPVFCNGQAEYEYVWKGCEG